MARTTDPLLPKPISHLAAKIPPTPRASPYFIRRFWGYVHHALLIFSLYYYCPWYGIPRDNQVARLPFGLVLKQSDGTRLEEVLAMKCMRAAGLPVPRVICYGEHPDTPHALISILMTEMPGSLFGEIYESLRPQEQANINNELKTYFNLIRSWENPWGETRICSITGGPIRSVRVPLHLIGPCENEEDFNHDLIKVAWAGGFKSPEIFEDAMTKAKRICTMPHKIVFTHGDLMHHNILIHEGHVSAILDWEASGWYPEYWEYTTALRFQRRGSWWFELVERLGGGRYFEELECERYLAALTSESYCW